MYKESGCLFGDGFDQAFALWLSQELVAEFGPLSEGRFVRGPFTIAGPAELESVSHLAPDYLAEHRASLERLGLLAEAS